MKNYLMVILLLAAVVLALAPAVQAAPIDLRSLAATNVTASSTIGFGRTADRVSDWSGMTGTFPDGTASDQPGPPIGTMWEAASHTGWIAWNLGAEYTVGSMHVWNYNETGYGIRGVKSLDFQTSSNGIDWTTLWTFDWSAHAASGAPGDPGFDYVLPAPVTTQYIRFANLHNFYPDLSLVGLAEVVFYENIPEPATMSLLALGGLAALIRRRRA